MGNGLKMPKARLTHGKHAHVVDPNPALLFNVFGGMLMTAAGLFYRLLALDLSERTGVEIEPLLRELHGLFDRAQSLQNDHRELIYEAGSENEPLYPIGEHTIWTTDLLRYRRIRDESVQVFLRISRETLRVTPYAVASAAADQLAWDLRAIQRSLDSSFGAGTFREAAFALSGGFAAAASSLQALMDSDHDDLDDAYMPFV
jgi:hypothetical protein